MKKAFEQNVSRAKPRLRLGGLVSAVVEAEPVQSAPEAPAPAPDLAATLKAKVGKANGPKPTAAEAMQKALDGVAHEMVEHIAASVAAEPVMARSKSTREVAETAVHARAEVPVARGQGEKVAARESARDAESIAAREAPQIARAAELTPVARAHESTARESAPVARAPELVAASMPVARATESVPMHEPAVVARAAAEFTPVARPAEPVPARAFVESTPVAFADSTDAFAQPARAEVVAPIHTTHAALEGTMPSPIKTLISAPVAAMEPPVRVVEVQTEAPPSPVHHEDLSPELRRERLKERLKAVRENPRPEPLPATVAETGLLAVGRISVLQAEVAKLKSLNLALTQDLEAARRTAEKATEEARSRMEEARRLTSQMEERARLLSELERELQALEGERDESLLKLQEARQSLDASAKEKDSLNAEIAKRDAALQESLSEEEKLAADLEAAHEDAATLRRGLDAVTTERDTLARQVAELTAERAELMEARRALEAVHRALANAAAK